MRNRHSYSHTSPNTITHGNICTVNSWKFRAQWQSKAGFLYFRFIEGRLRVVKIIIVAHIPRVANISENIM